jgi:deoxyribodipyrimidine photolyase
VFESLLLDHDVGLNAANWIYLAGLGQDPRDRSFKTVTQGIKYDPEGILIEQWVPELAHLPGSLRHQPWLSQRGYVPNSLHERNTAIKDGADVDNASYVASESSFCTYPLPIIEPESQVGKVR